MSKVDRDNQSNQLNPNNDAYWQSRQYDERPDDWQERVEAGKQEQGEAKAKRK